MKFSEETLNVLKNYATINPSILFRPGNVLSTMTVNKSMMSKATVSEVFDKRFAIYELTKFLGVISIFTDPVFDFQDKMVVISQGNQKISYSYADESVIVSPSKELVLPSEDAVFDIKADQLATLIKSINIMQLPEMAIVGDGETISVQATNSKNKMTDVYNVTVGETTHKFTMYISAEKLKLLPNDYTVTVCAKGMVRLDSPNITYWIATETYSKFTS